MYMHNICSHCTGHKRTQFTTPPRAGDYYNGAKIQPQFIISLAFPLNAVAASPHGHGNVWWGGRYVVRL